jgi:D-beta-D-heptose 7-phosphate kinase/D-beta-D-heptose 1-phosphate adenosyltransferase
MEKKIIWTNGCFDVLHRGHIELFKYAKSLGDELIVGIDSDEKVKKDKGNDRPFNNVKDRKEVLEAIKYIDGVFIFNDTQGLDDLIRVVGPDIMVIGSDWKGKTVVGEQHVNKLIFFDRLKNYSTTNILEWKNQ